jgi:hypothetical protein
MTYPFSMNGRVTDAGASLFGAGNDAFIDMAVPWSDLAPLGLAPTTGVTIWAASSTNIDRLDGDFACHDGAGGTATPTLSQAASSPIAPDPARSPGPVGGPSGGAADAGGNIIGGSGIEGGPGCSCDAGTTAIQLRSTEPAGLVGFVLAAGALVRRKRRPAPA